MSVKKDPSGRRSVQVEVEVPGTPEEVWRAIATGPGVSAWFVPTEIDGREGGSVKANFGPGMDSVSAVTAWQPPHRFAAESSFLGPNVPAIATEWIVEARAGGTCVVRVVHSLFASTDDWDNQLEGVESGWPSFFRILRLYLTHFPGERGSAMQLGGSTSAPRPEAWATLTGALGLAAPPPGQRFRTGGGVTMLAGVVERLGEVAYPEELLLRLDDPAPGLVHLFVTDMGGQVYVSFRFYLYGDRGAAVVSRDGPGWQAWMSERFPAAGGGCHEA